ncbi:MAG TPA: hypothetical protein VN158_05165 [Caulobacter sp.]|nr:hypothetical protein [Caulobacter sp.]
MSTEVASAEKMKSHELHCLADCGIVVPPTAADYASILMLSVVIAAAWIGVRRLTHRRKRTDPSGG